MKKEITKEDLFKKFESIGYLDDKELIEKLEKMSSITEMLNFLKLIKEKYYDAFQSIIKKLSEEENNIFLNNRTYFWEKVFGNYALMTPIYIQESVSNLFFKNGLNQPEFTYWFLKYNAQEVFNHTINSNEFKNKINSNLRDTFINSELKQLNEIENQAKELLLSKELDIYKPHRNNYRYNKEVVLLRVLDGNYYKQNTTYSISNWGAHEVQAYFKHILLKSYLENLSNEKYPRVKNLFLFIEYLYSNIENFNEHNNLIEELELLDEKRNSLKPRNNYKDKLQYDKIQVELKSKFKLLQDNTANLIKSKAKELNICNFEKEPIYNFNGIELEIEQLKENFSDKDLLEIFKYKSQYIKYRSQTHKTFLSLHFFYNELDEITKNLFDYFKDTEKNEFETFETETIRVNSIAEVIKGFKKGQTKFTLSNDVLLNAQTKDETLATKSENFTDEENENNDFVNSTIEDYLDPIKQYFNPRDYDLLICELNSYFKTGTFTNSNEIIKTINKPNKKLIGWQLKELYHASFNDNRNMNIDYLRFGKQRISVFIDVSFDEKQITKSNLYKYYHSKP